MSEEKKIKVYKGGKVKKAKQARKYDNNTYTEGE